MQGGTDGAHLTVPSAGDHSRRRKPPAPTEGALDTATFQRRLFAASAISCAWSPSMQAEGVRGTFSLLAVGTKGGVWARARMRIYVGMGGGGGGDYVFPRRCMR
jgi:hypothetical protein